MPKLPWTKKNACMGSVTYRNMQTLSVQHKPDVFPCVSCMLGEEGQTFEDTNACFRGAKCLRQLCEVMPKYFFSIWVIVQYQQYGAKRSEALSATVRLQLIHDISVTKSVVMGAVGSE